MTTCRECGAPGQPDGARFCFTCGVSLDQARCVSCRADIVPGARFCSACGAAQEGAETPASRPPIASRRVTSVLFGDLVGFTSLAESRDQEEVRELLSRYFEECTRIVARYGGLVEKFIGDAVMAVWGVPTAHEDDAERAVRAGLELVNRIQSLGADLQVTDLAMRVGIVTGEVAVTIGADRQGMVAGDAVNTAARVQAVAAPGQVWVDETTRLLTTSAISYVDVGSHAMKGKADPVPLWTVRAVVAAVGGAQRADGLEAPHIGRERDLRLVKELFHGVEESGRPALLVVDGEPGVGKTRLGWEFEKYSDGLSAPVRWHSGRCLSYGEGVAFFALAEAIRGRLQLLGDDAAAQDEVDDQGELLELGLDRYVPDPAERTWLRPRLGALLGIGAVATFPREDLFSAWSTFLHRVSEDSHPVVLVIDDAQHADDGLLLFLEYLLGVGTFPCFVLLLARTGLVEANPSLATNRRSTVLHLEPLSAPEMGVLLDGLVHGLPDGLRDSLVARAEGVPLFAVETVRSLIDRDLVIPRGGQYVLTDPDLDLGAIGAPASLQALISARLDTLPATERQVMDQASVVGESFPLDVIAALCPGVPDLEEVLAGLIRLQLLRRESNRFSTELGQFQFVQGAVRQVAYGMLARRDRKASHLAIARLLEAGDDTAGQDASIIAQHYLEALDAVPGAADAAELTDAAVHHLERAAARASTLGSPEEAAGHLHIALTRCRDEHRAAVLEADLAEQLVRMGDAETSAEHATHAGEVLDRLGDPLRAGSAVATLALALIERSEFARAQALVDERLAVLDGVEGAAPVLLTLTQRRISALLRTGADFREAAEQEGRLAELVGSPVEIAGNFMSLALHYMIVGPRQVARVLMDSAADRARDLHDTRLLTRVLSNLNAEWTQDDAERASELGREAADAGRRMGDTFWIRAANLNLLMALYVHGDWDDALAVDFDGSAFAGVYRHLVERGIALARDGLGVPPPALDVTEADRTDPNVVAMLMFQDAYAALAAGDPAAGGLALAAARGEFELVGLFDDFSVVWQAATDVAWQAGDRTALDALLAIVEDAHDHAPPTGIKAQHARMRGLLASLDEAPPEQVEEWFRTAVSGADAWRSTPTAARARAELGTWLVHQGRVAEAEPLLAAARETFDRLGARRWTAQLEAELAGVDA